MLSLCVLQGRAATSVAVPAWMAEYSTIANTSVCCTRSERISQIPCFVELEKKMLQRTDGQVMKILITEKKTNDCS